MATWLPESGNAATEFERVFERRPNLRADYERFLSLLFSSEPVDRALLELCRLRIVQVLGGAVPENDPRIAALESWRESAELSDRERACLELAEKFTLDPHGVTDADVAAVTAHLSAAQTVAFVEALALFDGFTRFRLILGIEEG